MEQVNHQMELTIKAGITDSRLLTHRGYAIRKDCLGPAETAAMKRALTMTPRSAPDYPGGDPFPIFFESPACWYVPRFWGLDTFGAPESDIRSRGEPLRPELRFIKELRENQLPIVEAYRNGGDCEALNRRGSGGESGTGCRSGASGSSGAAAGDSNGLICVPCGFGKTFMAIHEAIRIGGCFLIFVHQEFLADQWTAELEAAVPGIRVGRVQGNLCQTGAIDPPKFTVTEIKAKIKALDPTIKLGNKKRDELLPILYSVAPEYDPAKNSYDCAVCLIQTIVSRPWAKDTFTRFRFSIWDECHHLGAAHFCKALMVVQTMYSLGLSATPQRADGLEDIFKMFLGPVRYQISVREPDRSVEVRVIKYHSADPAYATVPYDFRGKVNRARLCNQIAECTHRTQHSCDELEPSLREGRKLLILSDRREHLAEFERILRGKGFDSIGYYVGGMSSEARQESAKERIILATYTLAAEGMNIRDLDSILQATSHSNIEQAVGRIFRLLKEERRFAPIIWDMNDVNIPCLAGQLRKRVAFYRKCDYTFMNRVSCGKWTGGALFPVADDEDEDEDEENGVDEILGWAGTS